MAQDKNTISREAQKYASKGQFDKAVAEWQKLVKETHDTRDLATIYNTIGDLHLKRDAKGDAADAYKRAADILSDDGLDSKAIAVYKKILNIDPAKIEVHLALGDLNARKGLTGSALESYKVAADYYQKHKDIAKTLGIYQKMADLNPSNTTFRTKLAEMYVKEGMKKEAVAAYLAAATAHMGADKFHEARQVFEKVLALDPGNKEVYYKAGIVYFKEGKFVEACKAFKPVFEGDPANAEVADLYLDALEKAERDGDAVEAYEKLLALDPSRTGLRAKLFHVYRKQQAYEKALAEARLMADEQVKSLLSAATAQGHPLLPGVALPGADQETEAERALKLFLEENPDVVEAHYALSDYYEKIGRPHDAASQILKIAGILTAKEDFATAREALLRALELWPDLDGARQRLEELDRKSAPPASPAPEKAAPPHAAAEEDQKINEGLAETEVLVKYGLAAKALEQLEALAKQFPDSLRTRLRLRDLYREQGNAQKAVDHALKAADICSRQGIGEQAETVLREALAIDPSNAEILSRLGMAAEAPPAQAEKPAAVREAPPAEEPSVIELAEPAPQKKGPPDVAPAFGEALSIPEAELPELVPPGEEAGAFPGETTALPAEAAAEATFESVIFGDEAPAKELAAEPAAGEIDISEVWAEAEFYYQQGLFDEARKKYEKILEHNPDDKRSRKRIKEISRQKEDVQEFSNLAEAVEGLESVVSESEPGSGELGASKSDEEAVKSLMKDIHHLRQQEREGRQEQDRRDRRRAEQEALLRAEQDARQRAEQELRELKERFEREARDRARQEEQQRTKELLSERRERERLAAEQDRQAAARDAAMSAFETAARRAMERPEEDFSDLNEELRGPAPAAGTPSGNGAAQESFFDLAAELRDELSNIPVPEQTVETAEEQTLDDIFADFKKGVEEQEIKQDANAHYNLGISYKEMGLLDEAIAEFLMTTEGESRFVESRYLLGLCYLEQGNYQQAAIEITNALNYAVSYGGTDEERMSMLYDLGLAYQGSGAVEEAINQFQQVLNMNPQYRDVAMKLHELKAGELISMDQLKEDIEKEISTKFLEEGERVEREEKRAKTTT